MSKQVIILTSLDAKDDRIKPMQTHTQVMCVTGLNIDTLRKAKVLAHGLDTKLIFDLMQAKIEVVPSDIKQFMQFQDKFNNQKDVQEFFDIPRVRFYMWNKENWLRASCTLDEQVPVTLPYIRVANEFIVATHSFQFWALDVANTNKGMQVVDVMLGNDAQVFGDPNEFYHILVSKANGSCCKSK